MNINTDQLKYNQEGLIPVVVQESKTKQVLMLAYMNEEALKQTIVTKQATYYSRSRKSLWVKGETSRNSQRVVSISYDCDADSLLLMVEQTGVACHTGEMSCFHNPLIQEVNNHQLSLLEDLYQTIKERKTNPVEGSYTTYLFTKGIDKILKKVGEETAEVIIAVKNHSSSEMTYEISDLVYHTLVLMVQEGIKLDQIETELKRRQTKS
jgi:phosphoribosyl-ATP pyrophosphohydrolase/phosphoribosyl-AMP cyclohydrolase